jgi:hypothetical protein
MEQSPSWEDKSLSTSQYSLPFMELEVSLPYSQQPTINPYPEPHESSPQLSTQFPYDPF